MTWWALWFLCPISKLSIQNFPIKSISCLFGFFGLFIIFIESLANLITSSNFLCYSSRNTIAMSLEESTHLQLSVLNHFAFIQASSKPEQSMNVAIARRFAKTRCCFSRHRAYLFLKSLCELVNVYAVEYKSSSKTITVFLARKVEWTC